MKGETANYDINFVRKRALEIAHQKANQLRQAGIPVTSEVWSMVQKQAYREARGEAPVVSYDDLTEEQRRLLDEVLGR